jgi:hypothetical protein
MLKNKKIFASILALIWLFLVLFPWQARLSSLPVLQFLIGFALFLLPGVFTVLYFDENKIIHPKSLLKGLAVSVFAAGILGFFARLLQLNFTFILLGFALWGIVIIPLVMLQNAKWQFQFERPTWWELVILLAAVVGVGYFMTYARPPLIHDDAFTYNALLYYYQHAPKLNFQFPEVYERLEIPRFWIAFWPLVEALISRLSGVDGLIITGVFLPPMLAGFSFMGIYVLARTLGLPRPAAAFAVLMQGFSLMRLTRFNQPGNLFFQRLTEDKVAAAFVLSLALFLLVVEYFDSPTTKKLVFAAIAALAMVFTHPIQFGMSCMILGVYGLVNLFNRDLRWKYIALIGALAVIVLIPYSFRFGGGEYSQTLSFSLDDVAENDEFARFGVRRVDVIEGTRFYGISQYLTTGLPYEISLVSVGLSLFFFWKNNAARFVLAAFAVLGVSMFPYTGWIVGMFTTPFQLWRLTWQMPFGIAFGFLVWGLWQVGEKIKPVQEWRRVLQPAFNLAVLVGAIAAIVYVRPWAIDNLPFNNLDYYDIYSNFVSMGNYLNNMDVQGNPVIAGGPDDATNSIIPSLTLKYVPVAFRVSMGGARADRWQALVAGNATPDERISRWKDDKVEYLLLRGEPDWLSELRSVYPERVKLLFEDRRFSLYQILPE